MGRIAAVEVVNGCEVAETVVCVLTDRASSDTVTFGADGSEVVWYSVMSELLFVATPRIVYDEYVSVVPEVCVTDHSSKLAW